jgi:multisubunit Na+/H+ antiporter MnhC subunit
LTMLGVGVGWWIAPQSQLEMSLIGLGIFGVGVLLYDFLTGQRPVTSEIRNALRMLKSSRQPA